MYHTPNHANRDESLYQLYVPATKQEIYTGGEAPIAAYACERPDNVTIATNADY